MKKYHNYTGEDFTFVICAYGECRYLEEAVRSLEKQTMNAKILISTSTPNDHINKIARKYNIEVRINPDGGQIKDYNFAMKQPDTELLMLMHQDEVLMENFLEKILYALNHTKKPIIAFTNYVEMHQDVVDEKTSLLLKIKRIMLLPACIHSLSSTWFGKRMIQLFGNPIAHPTVVCVRCEMPDIIFKEGYYSSMDWDLWERLSKQKGSFVYCREVLLHHRMNDENQTSKLFKTTNYRYQEGLEIFTRFWPEPIAKFIMRFYSKSEEFY